MCFPGGEWFVTALQNQELCPFYSHAEAGVEYTCKLVFFCFSCNVKLIFLYETQGPVNEVFNTDV